RGSKLHRAGFLASSWHNFLPLAASFHGSHCHAWATSWQRDGTVCCRLLPLSSGFRLQRRFLDIGWQGGTVTSANFHSLLPISVSLSTVSLCARRGHGSGGRGKCLSFGFSCSTEFAGTGSWESAMCLCCWRAG